MPYNNYIPNYFQQPLYPQVQPQAPVALNGGEE